MTEENIGRYTKLWTEYAYNSTERMEGLAGLFFNNEIAQPYKGKQENTPLAEDTAKSIITYFTVIDNSSNTDSIPNLKSNTESDSNDKSDTNFLPNLVNVSNLELEDINTKEEFNNKENNNNNISKGDIRKNLLKSSNNDSNSEEQSFVFEADIDNADKYSNIDSNEIPDSKNNDWSDLGNNLHNFVYKEVENKVWTCTFRSVFLAAYDTLLNQAEVDLYNLGAS